MRRLPYFTLALCLLLTACASTPSTPLPTVSAPRATPRIRNTTYYTKRCWPACHYDASLIKDAPIPVSYDFDGQLESGWAWVNEDPTHWTLTEVPGTLRILSQRGSISGDFQGVQNVLLRDAPEDHFDIIAKVTFDPTSNFQDAFIFIQMEDSHLVSLSRGYCQEGADPSCVGSGVYFDGSDVGCVRVGGQISTETLHLMLRRAGNTYIGYYYLGEGDWVEVGRCYNITSAPTSIGLAATSGDSELGASEIPADFDNFTFVERH